MQENMHKLILNKKQKMKKKKKDIKLQKHK